MNFVLIVTLLHMAPIHHLPDGGQDLVTCKEKAMSWLQTPSAVESVSCVDTETGWSWTREPEGDSGKPSEKSESELI